MEDVTSDLEQKLMISAFSKFDKIQKYDFIGDVTIGPNSNQNSPVDKYKPNPTDEAINKKQHLKTSVIQFDNIQNVPIRQILREYETKRQEEVKNAFDARVQKIEDFGKLQECHRKERQIKQNEEILQSEHQRENVILDGLKQYDKKMLNDQTKLMQQFQNAAVRRRNQELALEAKEKQRQLINSYIDKIKKSQLEYRDVYQHIVAILKSCKDNAKLKEAVTEEVQIMKSLSEDVDMVLNRCKSGKISEDEVRKLANTVHKIKLLKEKIEKDVDTINKEIEFEKTIQKQREENRQQQQQQQQLTEKIQDPRPEPQTSERLQEKNDNLKRNVVQMGNISDLTQFISVNNFHKYMELMEFLQNHTASFKELTQDSSLKQFKFDCKKAINIPVNALSDINSEHILDKYKRLHTLLSGANLRIGDNQINASNHPQGIAFCMDLLAKQLVLQGDLMVSSKPESAFCYATVIVSLWNDFPTLGKLLLAYFFKACPYLVPFYIPKEVGESDEDYYIKRGYQYKDGQIEKHDKFLKRMTGIMRLYSAVMIAKPKRGQSTSPYNLKNGWIWYSSILKLEPQVDITATVLHAFLETAGFEMDIRYGRVFKKLLKITMEKMLPQCKAKCTGGAVTRLELLFEEYIKNGSFQKPNGFMDHSYW